MFTFIPFVFCLTVGFIGILEGVPQRERRQTRIHDGTPAEKGEFPWMVNLRMWDHQRLQSYHWCGGSLISKNLVLTAAHCVTSPTSGKPLHPSLYRVRSGDYNSEVDTFEHSVTKIIVHPEYRTDVIYLNINYITEKYELPRNDIALLVIEPEVNCSMTEKVHPIALPLKQFKTPLNNFSQSRNLSEFASPNANCTVLGWGRTEEKRRPKILQKLFLDGAINYERCNQITKYAKINMAIESDAFCAGYIDGRKGVCDGDSGGPVACVIDGHWEVVGIVSWGEGCAKKDFLGVYADVTQYIDWIYTVTHSDFELHSSFYDSYTDCPRIS